jgi:hypothetical protein
MGRTNRITKTIRGETDTQTAILLTKITGDTQTDGQTEKDTQTDSKMISSVILFFKNKESRL